MYTPKDRAIQPQQQQQQQGEGRQSGNVHVLCERESAFSNTRPKNGHLIALVDTIGGCLR